jgi:hypothetical protein
MARRLTIGFALLASGLLGLASVPAASASTAASALAAPARNGKVTVRHWIGTWRGKASQHPAAPPGDPRNPYKIVVTIRSVSKHAIGTVRYPAWKCNYTLIKRSATPKKLVLTMKVVHPGPFNCVSRESAVMRPSAKGASWHGTFEGGIETGSVKKSS